MASVDLIELLLEEHFRVGVSDWAKMNGWDFTSWKWWPGGGIEPPSRGFSVRRTARLGSAKPKTGKGFLLGRPNRPPDRTYPEPEA